MTERLPSDAECPAGAYALDGLAVVDNGAMCPECGERVAPAMAVPRRAPHPAISRCGMIPGLVVLAFGALGWLLHATRSYLEMMNLMFLSFFPLCGAVLISLCIGVTMRVRSVNRRYRMRILLLSLLIAAAWISSGAAVYASAMARAAAIAASV